MKVLPSQKGTPLLEGLLVRKPLLSCLFLKWTAKQGQERNKIKNIHSLAVQYGHV